MENSIITHKAENLMNQVDSCGFSEKATMDIKAELLKAMAIMDQAEAIRELKETIECKHFYG